MKIKKNMITRIVTTYESDGYSFYHKKCCELYEDLVRHSLRLINNLDQDQVIELKNSYYRFVTDNFETGGFDN